MKKKRLKVLCITDGIGPPAARGGEAIYDLQVKLSQAGAKIHILTAVDKFTLPGWREWFLEQERQHQIVFHYFNLSLIRRFHCLNRAIFKFLFLPAAIRLHRQYQFDLIHEYASSPLVFDRLGFLKLFFKIPLVCSLVTYNVILFGLPQLGSKGRWLDKILVTSRSLEKGLKEAGFDKHKIGLLPLGIEVEKFQPGRSRQLRKKAKLPINKKIVLYLGPFNQQKGILIFLKAALKVLKKRTDVIFLIVSYREGEAAVKRQAVSLIRSKQEYFYFWDRLVDVPSLLAMIDIFALPLITPHGSISPPITLLEAMAAGKAIVASKIPGVNEVILDGKTGFLFENQDIQDLARKITSLLESERLREDFGRQARKYVLDRFELEKATRQLMVNYSTLVFKKC